MNNLKKTYPAYDNWLSKNMVELKKAVAHLPMEETSDIIEVAGRLIWLAAQNQNGYVMVPVEKLKAITNLADQLLAVPDRDAISTIEYFDKVVDGKMND